MYNAFTELESYNYVPNKLNIDLKNGESPVSKSSIIEPTILELTPLLSYWRHAFFGANESLSIVIFVELKK